MSQNFYYLFLILLILPNFGENVPIEFDEIFPSLPKLYHDHSIISYVNNNQNKQHNSLEKSINNYDDEISYRLPNNTSPISYNIKLATDVHVGKFEFSGTNEIELKANEATNNITIHGRQIKITAAKLIEKDSKKEIELKEWSEEPAKENELLVFKLKDNIKLEQNKEYILQLIYTGKLRNDSGGFYLSKYIKNNEEVYLATTQFESTDARHGFPCYDEPGIKATFTIEITHGANYTALSNMPEANRKDGKKGYKITTFETTKKMSPYLVAFVVSDFTGKFADDKNKLQHGVYSRPGTEDERSFALESSIEILNAIQEYVDYDYSFPKMDQISIPDFAPAAMENWGLVTYSEELLLYNEKSSIIATKTGIATTVAHEYGHQWFGNLVSPKWWTYLWLNEGFASLFAYIGVEKVYKDWDIMEHFIVSEYQRALKSDEGINKRPMTHYVDQPREIVGLFDSVSYSKAACVIQMIRNYVGETAFKKSLNNYLKKMEYKSATEEDLFDSLQAGVKEEGLAITVTFKELMGSWSRQGGFPLLSVKRDYAKGTFQIEQNGFQSDSDTEEDLRQWWIPVNFASANNPDFDNTTITHLFNDTKIQIEPSENEKISDKDWLILNKQLTGYYRVNYDDKNWELISNALRDDPSQIHKYNRAQLITDSYRLSLRKLLKLEQFFNLMEYLPKETEYSPWSSVNEAFTFYRNIFYANENIFKNLQFFILKSVSNLYGKLGVKDENAKDRHFDKYLRSIAINWACAAGSEECLKNTNDLIKDLVEKKKEIEPNLQSVIYCNGLRKSNDKEFEYMFQRLLNSDVQAERYLIMSSLGCSHKKEHLKKFVESSIDKNNNLRTLERISVLYYVFPKSKEAFEVAVEFLKEKYDDYSKLQPGIGQPKPLNDVAKALAGSVVDDWQKKLIEELVRKVKDHDQVDKDLEKKVNELMEMNLKWGKANEDSVKDYLADFFKRNSAGQLVVSLMALAAVIVVSLNNTL